MHRCPCITCPSGFTVPQLMTKTLHFISAWLPLVPTTAPIMAGRAELKSSTRNNSCHGGWTLSCSSSLLHGLLSCITLSCYVMLLAFMDASEGRRPGGLWLHQRQRLLGFCLSCIFFPDVGVPEGCVTLIKTELLAC